MIQFRSHDGPKVLVRWWDVFTLCSVQFITLLTCYRPLFRSLCHDYDHYCHFLHNHDPLRRCPTPVTRRLLSANRLESLCTAYRCPTQWSFPRYPRFVFIVCFRIPVLKTLGPILISGTIRLTEHNIPCKTQTQTHKGCRTAPPIILISTPTPPTISTLTPAQPQPQSHVILNCNTQRQFFFSKTQWLGRTDDVTKGQGLS